jgi:hypothetical protein
MRKPWEVAPPAMTGDPDVAKIYNAVGLALSRWEILEVALSYLHGAIAQPQTDAEATAYRKAAPGQPRLQLIARALEAQRTAMPRPLHAEIVAFLDGEVAPLAERRNEIARGTAVLVQGGLGGHYLVPPGYTPRRLQWRRVPVATDAFPFRRFAFVYTGSQVADYGERFWESSRRGFQFCNRVVEAREAVAPPGVPRTPPLVASRGARRHGPRL